MNYIIALYGHIRKRNFILHIQRIFSNKKLYMHTWEEFSPLGITWHGQDAKKQKIISQRYIKNLKNYKNLEGLCMESQNIKELQKIPTFKRRYYSIIKSLELIDDKESLILVTRPDIIHHKKINLEKIKLDKNEIACSFDIGFMRAAPYPKIIGANDIVLIGYKKTLIKLCEGLLAFNTEKYQLKSNYISNPKDFPDDYEFFVQVAKKIDLNIFLMGYLNERDYHIWRYKSRFRLKSLFSDLKDLIYSIKKFNIIKFLNFLL